MANGICHSKSLKSLKCWRNAWVPTLAKLPCWPMLHLSLVTILKRYIPLSSLLGYTGCDGKRLRKPDVTVMDRVDLGPLMISRWTGMFDAFLPPNWPFNPILLACLKSLFTYNRVFVVAFFGFWQVQLFKELQNKRSRIWPTVVVVVKRTTNKKVELSKFTSSVSCELETASAFFFK